MTPADSIALWRADGAIPIEFDDRIAGHPAFAASARQLAANMLALRTVDAALEGIFKDAGRYVAAMLAIYLHASGGLTMKRLRDACGLTGFLSGGRARALMFYMQYLGFVELLPRTRRGQSAAYIPTARFIRSWQMHLIAAIQAVALIAPEILTLLPVLEDEAAFGRFVALHCDALMQIRQERGISFAIEAAFLQRLAGNAVLWTFIVSEAPGADGGGLFPPEAPTLPALAAMARDFGVSRLHISRMLDYAEAVGLIARLEDGTVRILELARQELTQFYGSQLVCLLVAAARFADQEKKGRDFNRLKPIHRDGLIEIKNVQLCACEGRNSLFADYWLRLACPCPLRR